ncbi:MAG: hypothetical protein ACI30J_08810 [Paludibacteraceae bacterium]
MLQNGADSVAPLLSLTQRNACQPFAGTLVLGTVPADRAEYLPPYITVALRSAVIEGFAGMACATDWLIAPRPTIIGYNCFMVLTDFFLSVVTCMVQSFLFSSALRLFSHCKGKTRLLRTAPFHSAMQGQALRVW